jgi:oxygen-dependent protoporphyrinogen oxidase
VTPSIPTSLPAIVIGAGISGLTCAHTLRQRGIHAHVFEASRHAGGVIRSEQRDGFLFELGPQSFTFTDSLRQLCRELRIENQIQPAPEKLPRYLLLDGQLLRAPLSPPAFFLSPLFSARTKWSVVRDALGTTKPPVSPNAGDESIANFVRRKFGAELLEKLVGPFVSGIYAGDPEKLGLRSAFPQLYNAENSRGSVVRGLLRGKKAGPRTLASFAGGNDVLTDALAASLGAALHLDAAVTRVAQSPHWAPGRFVVEFATSAESEAGATIYTDHLIVATAAPAAGKLLAELDAKFTPLFEAMPYVPIAVVSLGYRREAVKNSLQGFGFLAPRTSGLRTLGCVWNSSLFPDRAPQDSVLLTSFVGGAFDTGAPQLPPQELQNIVHQELRRVLGISEMPVIANVQIWPQAIPQYDPAHFRRGITCSQKVAGFPGLALAGNYLDGPAIGTVVDRARKLADYVLDGPPR